jgi:hypothetical protein
MNQELLRKINKGNYMPKARKYINPPKIKLLSALDTLEELAADACHGTSDAELDVNNAFQLLFGFIINNSN